MITPSFSPTATERVLPKLALDFTTANLDSRVTFTRTTDATHPATYVNSSGYVTSATNNQPRFDFNPVTLVCKGLLIEESRANMLLYSDQFDNVVNWIPSTTSVTANSTTSPDGTVNADTLVAVAGTASHDIRQALVTVTSSVYTTSVYAKAGTSRYIQICLLGDAVSFANFDLTGGVVGTTGGTVTSTISNAGNGWYRCSMTYTAAGVGISPFFAMVTSTSSARRESWTAVGTETMYLWGAQTELGAFPTSYIPTTTTALTRNADVATMTGTNFSSWWTATSGASDIWLIPKSTSTLAYMSFDDNTANNSIIIANSTTSGQSTITSSGSLQSTLTAGTITVNATNKVGCSWNTNNCAATANGTSPAITASATIPTVTQLRIGSNGTAYANAWIQKLFYWPQRITNNEIQAFTK